MLGLPINAQLAILGLISVGVGLANRHLNALPGFTPAFLKMDAAGQKPVIPD